MDRTVDIRWFRTQAATDLRDQFAAAALQGLLAGEGRHPLASVADDARTCYDYADALLAERERRTKEEAK